LLPEVSIPGGSVDYFLVSVHNDKVMDFVSIELQKLDITGSLWSERASLLLSKGLYIDKSDLSAKTILVQMHHKIHTFEYLDNHV
jgi:hypothetical protein